MNCIITNIKQRPYGYTGTAIIVDNHGCEHNSECFLGQKEPTTQELETLRLKKLAIAEADITEAPASNENLASLAVAAKGLLDKSNKIPPEAFEVLNHYVNRVKGVANSNPDDGTAATNLVNQMLATPELQADKELWKQINTMKEQIIQITGGVL